MQNKSGGLYKNVKMSVRTANLLVLTGIAVFVAVLVFAVSNNGFIIEFDTNGGTEVQSIKVMYGDVLSVPKPQKQGFEFSGWYRDKGCTNKWNDTDKITQSMTLYAKWQELTE